MTTTTQQKALDLLRDVIALRKERTSDLLADFRKGFAYGWKMAVGECFRAALDMRQLSQRREDADDGEENGGEYRDNCGLTQGNLFAFSAGDTIYDTPRAYGVWESAFSEIMICFQIREAQPVRPPIELVRIGKMPSFKGSLKGERRLEVFRNIPQELTPIRTVKAAVKKATGKNVSDQLLSALADIGAIKRTLEIVAERSPGTVLFDVLTPDKGNRKLKLKDHKIVTQDEFVRILISGLY